MDSSAPGEQEHDSLSYLSLILGHPCHQSRCCPQGVGGSRAPRPGHPHHSSAPLPKDRPLPAQPGSPRARSQEHRANLHPELKGTAPETGFLKGAVGQACACQKGCSQAVAIR